MLNNWNNPSLDVSLYSAFHFCQAVEQGGVSDGLRGINWTLVVVTVFTSITN